jgi:ribosomal-protein-alanine N-acetyltransferase
VQTIETSHLTLVPFSLDLMKATIADKDRLATLLAIAIPASWPGPEMADALPVFARNREKEPQASTWIGLIIHKTDKTLIGDIGFHGAPDEHGAVEIGYSIVPEYRNQGYATEMATALINWAFQEPGIKVITAETLKENTASIKVLTKVGMNCLATEDEWLRWEMHKPASPNP